MFKPIQTSSPGRIVHHLSRAAGAILLVAGLAGLAGCGGGIALQQANAGAPPNTGFMVKQVKVDGVVRHYGLFIPHAYTPRTRWPVIVFLHGVLQAGNDGMACMGVGLGPAVAERAATFPFIVVFPQSPGDWKGDARASIAMACLDQVQRDYSTDTGSVCLTGLSNGGYGTWALGARYLDRFSTLVPIAGYTDFDDVARLAKLPIWCFHNSGDFLVSPGGSAEMCERIKAAGGNVKFTRYDAIGHDCWTQTYARPDLFQWILANRRGGAAVAAAPVPAPAAGPASPRVPVAGSR